MSSLEPMCEGEKDEKGETERHRDRHRETGTEVESGRARS